MPAFGSPFWGLANDRKLKNEELIRAIRFMVAAEYEATQLYTQLAESTDNKVAAALLQHFKGVLVHDGWLPNKVLQCQHALHNQRHLRELTARASVCC